jgi:hypothetical protein
MIPDLDIYRAAKLLIDQHGEDAAICRMHGARRGAPSGEGNGQYRHGRRTKAGLAERRAARESMRQLWWLIDTGGYVSFAALPDFVAIIYLTKTDERFI